MNIKNLIKSFNIVFILFISITLFAQKEGNIWYFGQNAGIDFNGAAPVALTNGSLNTAEGCASISDTAGNLLFYTDGIWVWNKNHTIMQNGYGLMGDNTSTQSAIIVKKPGSTTLYYIFTVAASGGNNGLRYSIVDMSLQSGLGDVQLNKNNPIVTPVCEKVTAIKHQNNTDFWIVTHLIFSNSFHCYLLSSTGLNMTPVISNVGPSISNATHAYKGYMKASPDGGRLAMANKGMDNVGLFDFNNYTGTLSNPMVFTGFYGCPYGVEFSPNCNVLYVSVYCPPAYIYQLNLYAATYAAIAASKTIIGQASIGSSYSYGGALQLAPDNKIYHARSNKNFLGVINNPNLLLMNSNYSANGIYLGGKLSVVGLPPYFNSIIPDVKMAYSNQCFGDSTSFSVMSSTTDSVIWDFGDINSGVNNSSKQFTPKHLFPDTGEFVVKLIYYYGSIIDTVAKSVFIKPIPKINLGNDTSLCIGDVITLDATIPNASYIWQNTSTSPTFTVLQSGKFWVELTLNQCKSADTINITYKPNPIVNLGDDTILCPGEILKLDATTLNASYKWQDNSNSSTYAVSKEGNYWVEVTVNNCSSVDQINVNYHQSPKVNLGNDTTICLDEKITLDATFLNSTYKWQDNSTNSTYSPKDAGTYWVIVSDSNCSSSDTINIEFNDCEIILEMPNVFTPNADGNNDYFLPKEFKNIIRANIVIYNRWGRQLYESNNIMDGWNGKFEGNNCLDGTYYWIVKYVDINGKENSLNGFLSLLRN